MGNQLKNQFLFESKSFVLNALEKEFGQSIYSSDKNFISNTLVMNKVFNILNKTIFNKKLPYTNVLCLNNLEIQKIFNKYKHNRDPSNFYALYFPLPDWNKINFQIKNQNPVIQYMIINTDNCINISFIFAISSLCHEMIHQLDTLYGDVLFKFKIAAKNNISENEHNTEIFMKKESQINKLGLTIIPVDGGYIKDEINDLSIMRMKKLQEIENIIDNHQFNGIAMKYADIDKHGNIIAISF